MPHFAPDLRRAALISACVASVITLLAACSPKKPPAPPPAEVTVLEVAHTPATYTEDYVAQTEAVNTVEIRPRVGGVLEKQLPNEGEHVKAGELLFVIDPQPYIEALAEARATLAQNEASLEQSQRDLGRATSLSQIDAVSQQELDAAIAKNKANIASVAAGQGRGQDRATQPRLHQHRQSDRRHNGPRAAARRGHGSGQFTLLTTVYETSRVYVNLSISEQRLLALQRQLGRAPDQNSKEAPPFRLLLIDGSEYPLAPKLSFIDPAVDTRTGTLAIRLEVANPRPPAARRGVRTGPRDDARRIPMRSCCRSAPSRTCRARTTSGWSTPRARPNSATCRWVRASARLAGEKGLKAGDRVIVDGVQRLRPGMAVKATPYVAAEQAPRTAAAPGTGT